MIGDQAQSTVTLSAFVVAGIFGYRKLTETALPNNANAVPATAHFVIGFGFTYIILSLLAQGAPELGAMMAILVMVGDMLANGQPLINDVVKALNSTKTATK